MVDLADYITYEQAAKLAGVSLMTVQRWVKEHGLSKVRVPGRRELLIRRDEWEGLLAPIVIEASSKAAAPAAVPDAPVKRPRRKANYGKRPE